MKLTGLEVPSLLLQLESRVRVERQVWTSQSSKARQGGQPSAAQRESWGYEGHYSRAGCERKGVKETKAMKLQTGTQSCTRSGAFSSFLLSRMAWAENALKARTRPKRGGTMHWSALSSVRNDTKRDKRANSSSSLIRSKSVGNQTRLRGMHFQNLHFGCRRQL